MTRYGLEQPDERFEFARFCLLNHYARNRDFMAELRQLALRHRDVLDVVATQQVSKDIAATADQRIAWGLLSFLAREAPSSPIAGPLKESIDSYRADLQTVCRNWGLAANWCAPSLHVALLARKVFPGNFDGQKEAESLTPLFAWDVERQGEPPYDTVLSLPRLFLLSDAPGRGIDTRLVSRGDKSVYYDPRTDRWDEALARAGRLLARKRLSSTLREELLRRRRQIESAFLLQGYGTRRKPRRLEGQHALARWTYWTYRAICPPRLTTSEIVDLIMRSRSDGDPERTAAPQVVDRGIKAVLNLLGLPPRPVRPT